MEREYRLKLNNKSVEICENSFRVPLLYNMNLRLIGIKRTSDTLDKFNWTIQEKNSKPFERILKVPDSYFKESPFLDLRKLGKSILNSKDEYIYITINHEFYPHGDPFDIDVKFSILYETRFEPEILILTNANSQKINVNITTLLKDNDIIKICFDCKPQLIQRYPISFLTNYRIVNNFTEPQAKPSVENNEDWSYQQASVKNWKITNYNHDLFQIKVDEDWNGCNWICTNIITIYYHKHNYLRE